MQTKIVHIPMQRRPISRARLGGFLSKAEKKAMQAEETARVQRDAERCYWLNMLAALEGRLVPGYDLHGKRIAAEAIDADAQAEAEAIERAAEQAAEQAAEDNLGGFTDCLLPRPRPGSPTGPGHRGRFAIRRRVC